MSEKGGQTRTRGDKKGRQDGDGRGPANGVPSYDSVSSKLAIASALFSPRNSRRDKRPSGSTPQSPDFTDNDDDDEHLSESLSNNANAAHPPKTISLDQLNSTMVKMGKSINTALTEIRADMKRAQKTHNTRMNKLEVDIENKHLEISEKIELNYRDMDKMVKSSKRVANKASDEVEDLRQIIQQQQTAMDAMMATITLNETSSKSEINQVRILANNVEAHQRRWSIRLFGLPAPDHHPETTPEAKNIILDFIENRLGIEHVQAKDIDCAHRVGYVEEGRQPMLIRFFARGLTELIISKRRKLKGTKFVIHEDGTYLNMQLLLDVKDSSLIESAWQANGSIWGKTADGDKKIKFQLGDPIDDKIRFELDPNSIKRPPKPRRRRTKKPRQRSLLSGPSPPATTTPKEVAHPNSSTSIHTRTPQIDQATILRNSTPIHATIPREPHVTFTSSPNFSNRQSPPMQNLQESPTTYRTETT
jgi:hypothetical protein